MSPDIDVEKFRIRLEEMRCDLESQSEKSAGARKPVELDQQSVGRLSRQDALQQQAMATAQEKRRTASLQQIAAALTRIDDGDFGYCEECGDLIAPKRLDIDPTVRLCTKCAEGLRR